MNRKSIIRNNLLDIPFISIIIKYDYYLEGNIDISLYPEGIVEILRVLKDGRIVIAMSNKFEMNAIKIINPITNKESIIRSLVGTLTKMVILPDNRIIISGYEDVIGIINPDTEEYDLIFKEHQRQIEEIALLRDSKILSRDSNTILIWDSFTGKVENKLEVDPSSDFFTELPNNKILIGDQDLKIIDLKTHEIKILEKYINEGLLYEGNLLIIFRDGSSMKLDLNTQKIIPFINDLDFRHSRVIGIHGNYIITVGYGVVYFWNLETGLCDFEYRSNESIIQGLTLPDGRIALIIDYQILIFNVNDSPKGFLDPELIIDNHYRNIQIALLPDGRLVTTTHDENNETGELIIWK